MSNDVVREQRSARPAPGIRAGLLIVPTRTNGKPIHSGIRPQGDRILVYPCEVVLDNARSDLTRPDISEERADTGVVVATGPAAKHLSIGDIVWFGKYTGSYVAEEKLVIMREEEVIAVIDDYVEVRRREQSEEQRVEIVQAIDQFHRVRPGR